MMRTIKSYVHRAKRMTAAQKKAYEGLSGQWVLGNDKVVWESLFSDADFYVIEVGFGMGNATKELAINKANWGIVGIEVHPPGVGKLLWWIDRKNIDNIRIIQQDAVIVFEKQIPPESVDAIHIWFPDPWPKKKHHKRRLLNTDFLQSISRGLKVGGMVYVVTDWESYAHEIINLLEESEIFENCYDHWAPRQEYRPATKFEKKGIKAQRHIYEIIYRKVDITDVWKLSTHR